VRRKPPRGIAVGDNADAVDEMLGARDGPSLDAAAGAVRQGIAEVRRRNALVVAWVRIGLRCLTLILYLYGGLVRHDPGLAGMVTPNVVHLAAACLVAWLLLRRWRTTLVAFAAAALDLVVVFWVGWLGTAPGVAAELRWYWVGFVCGILQVLLLPAALVLPARLAATLAPVVLAFQVALSVRAGIAPSYWILGSFAVVGFGLVVVWTAAWMVKLAAGLAVREASAALAERHARALEEAHAEVAAQRDRLVVAQNQAEALAQVIVHDLKNPLATLLQYVALAETEVRELPDAAGLLDYLQRAGEEGRRLAKLIGDLLLVYRLERGAMAPTLEAVPLRILLHSVSRGFTSRARERAASLEIAADDDLVVPMDLDLMQRLLENLVSNALRHVGRGDRVSLEGRRADEGVRIAVRNSGPPIPDALRPSLFDRYVTAGRREWHNAGLGLYLCRLVAEAHAGSIALQDRPGWNVSFEVNLPLRAEPSPLRRGTVAQPPPSGGS
jgi:signal transduction histidine kinase